MMMLVMVMMMIMMSSTFWMVHPGPPKVIAETEWLLEPASFPLPLCMTENRGGVVGLVRVQMGTLMGGPWILRCACSPPGFLNSSSLLHPGMLQNNQKEVSQWRRSRRQEINPINNPPPPILNHILATQFQVLSGQERHCLLPTSD